MHEIEGLVEDSVHVVAKSRMKPALKRDFLYNLYRFQLMFDTGYTHFRVIDTLLELKFTYRIPLEKHPDYKKNTSYFKGLDVDKTYWLPSEIGKEGESVYAKKEDYGVFLYADAGSQFWQRLCEENILPKTEHRPPQKLKTSYLVWKLLEHAHEQDKLHLVRDWYACLVNMLGTDLGEEDGFPKLFLDFINAEEIAGIRAIGKAVNPFASPYEGDDWGYVGRPILKEIEEEENDMERLFCIKWLLDFNTDEHKLKAAYAKEIKPDPKKDAKLQLIPNAVHRHLGNKNWKLVWKEEHEYGHYWLYHHQLRGAQGKPQDTDLHAYLFLNATYRDTDKILYPKIGVQTGLLHRWQGRGVLHDPKRVHFFDTIMTYIPKKDWDENKSLHWSGAWKYSLRSSEKVLNKHLDNFFEYFRKYAPLVLVEYEKPLFNGFQMSLKKALAYREKIQQTHRFFLNEVEVYLVYAIHHFEKGEKDKAYELARKAKEMAEEKTHPIKKEWITAAESVLADQPKLNELLSFEVNYF